MGRILAIDFGLKRTGLAVTDTLRIIATGLSTVKTHELTDFLKKYIAKETVDLIVVGEPKQMDGTPSEITKEIDVFLKKLNKELPHIKVERQDERFSSKMAFQSLIDSGVKKKDRQNKSLIDEVSATIILQAYLERIG
jgi:putative holliday junction resolvase